MLSTETKELNPFFDLLLKRKCRPILIKKKKKAARLAVASCISSSSVLFKGSLSSRFPALVASKRKLSGSGEYQDWLKMLSVGGWKEWMCDVSEWRS